MIALCAEVGYPQVSVSRVSFRAGVSTATFYELFGDRAQCLRMAYRLSAGRVLPAREVGVAPGGRAGVRAWVRELLCNVQQHPDAARVLLIEGLAERSLGRDEFARAMDRAARSLERLLYGSSPPGLRPDPPGVALLGGVRAVLVRRLIASELGDLTPLGDDLVDWVYAYSPSGGELHAGVRAAAALLSARRSCEAVGCGAEPPRPPRGRHGLSPDQVAALQRARIVHATAQVMAEKGFEGSSAADIIRVAGISRHVLYGLFANRLEAFMTAQQHAARVLLDACEQAYAAAADWPERVWRASSVLLALVDADPALARLVLVESYAAGPGALAGVVSLQAQMEGFLHEGLLARPAASRPPALFAQASLGAVFELIQRDVLRGRLALLRSRLPLVSYLLLAPFIGSRVAAAALERLA